MFSKQLIESLVNFMPEDHASMGQYLIRHDLNDRHIVDLRKESIPKIQLAIINYLISNPDERDEHGESIVRGIVSEVVRILCNRCEFNEEEFDEDILEFKSAPNFYHYLRLDGYDIDFEKKQLKAILPMEIECQEKEDYILNFLDRYTFTVAKEHYLEAKDNYLRNNAAMTGQLRPFVESLLTNIARVIRSKENDNSDINTIPLEKDDAVKAMQVLAKCQHPILFKDLNEWDGQSKGYFEAFWRRLHPQGNHPGIPVLDEVVYRYQLVLINVTILIKRFESYYGVA